MYLRVSFTVKTCAAQWEAVPCSRGLILDLTCPAGQPFPEGAHLLPTHLHAWQHDNRHCGDRDPAAAGSEAAAAARSGADLLLLQPNG